LSPFPENTYNSLSSWVKSGWLLRSEGALPEEYRSERRWPVELSLFFTRLDKDKIEWIDSLLISVHGQEKEAGRGEGSFLIELIDSFKHTGKKGEVAQVLESGEGEWVKEGVRFHYLFDFLDGKGIDRV